MTDKPLLDSMYYWVKQTKDSEWEIAKYRESDQRLRFTNSSYMLVKDICEIDYSPIKRKKA
jgi:hypothetical protein